MTKRKGQFASMIGIVVLVFILSTNIFTVVIADNDVEETFEYNSGSFNPIADAKMKADHHPEKMSRELNYSSNIMALNLGDNSGSVGTNSLSWNDNVPTTSELKQEYIDVLTDEVESQNRVKNCDGPEVDSVYEPEHEISWRYNNTSLNLDFGGPWIICNAQNTEANVSTDSLIEVDNTQNRYIELANYSSVLGSKTRDISEDELPDSMSVEGSRSDSESQGSCENPDRSGARSDAKSDARDEAISQYDGIASDAWSQTSDDRPDYISSITIETVFPDSGSSYSGNIADPTQEECSYSECTDYEDTDDDGDTECVDSETRYNTQYNYKYKYEPDYIGSKFDYEDGEYTIIDSSGTSQNLNFFFEYKHPVN